MEWNSRIEATSRRSKNHFQLIFDVVFLFYNLDKDESSWYVHTNIGTLEAPFVLLATGAAEYSIPLPGWTLPGVMSIRAAQVMTNVHRVQVGKKESLLVLTYCHLLF